MRLLSRLGGPSVVVGVLTAISAVQLALITIGNITDYDTNYAFVQHVFAMDTTFKSPHMMWRAITSPALVTAAYVLIIIWEGLSAVALIAAVVAWIRGSVLARRLSALGWLMEATLFGGGFIAIGGEYFQMWQSSKWNGLSAALQNVIIASVGLMLTQLAASRGRERAGDLEVEHGRAA
jgi:predicted small integral membrane protein